MVLHDLLENDACSVAANDRHYCSRHVLDEVTMARRVFFSFHYQDVIDFRANVVRNHWLLKEDHDDAGFFDASLWESSKARGPDSLKRLISNGLEGTSVTCVLIGSGTFARPWVRYELLKSLKRGNKIVAVHKAVAPETEPGGAAN
jgi:hypothetical protein